MSDFAKGRAAQRQTIKDQAAEITRLRAELATARRDRMEEAAQLYRVSDAMMEARKK